MLTERERWSLRGRVRSCRLERRWYSRICGADACETEERGDTTTLDFRPDGTLSKHKHQNPDGSEWNTIYHYSDAGLLTRTQTEGGDGVTNLQLYEYDDAGRLFRVFARLENVEHTLETYEYDPSGSKRRSRHIDVGAQRPDTQYAWAIEGTDNAYSAPGTASLTTLYNQRDQPAVVTFHDLAGGQLSRVDLRYDEAGQLMEEAQTHSVEVVPPEILASLNAAQSRTVRGLFSTGGILSVALILTTSKAGWSNRVRIWDNWGLTRKRQPTTSMETYLPKCHEHEERECAIDDEGQIADEPIRQNISRSETRFRYDYDLQENWVSKTVECRHANGDEFSLSTVERRTIEYFD